MNLVACLMLRGLYFSITPAPSILRLCLFKLSCLKRAKTSPPPASRKVRSKRKKTSCFLLEPWHSGAVQECTYSRIFPHSWVVERNQQRHVPYTPQISELATTKDTHSELSALGQQLLSVSYSSHDAVCLLLLQLHTKKHITPVQALEKTTQTNSHSGPAILAAHQYSG